MERGGSGQVQYLWIKKCVVCNRRVNKNLCLHKKLSLVLHKLACIPHQVCHSTSLHKFDFSEGKMSGRIFPCWFPLNSLLTQIKLLWWLMVVQGQRRSCMQASWCPRLFCLWLKHKSWIQSFEVEKLQCQIHQTRWVLLPAVASTDFTLPSPPVCQLLGEWFSWKPINSQALFFQKGKKHRSQVTWSQIFDHIYLVLYSLSSRPDTSFCLTIAWPLNKFHSIVKGS